MRDQGLSVTLQSAPLVSEAASDAAKLPVGFARSFLSKAKRPQFIYIAPGLSIPEADTFMPHPFCLFRTEDEYTMTIEPILLFRSSEWFDVTSKGHGYEQIFTYPFSSLHTFPEVSTSKTLNVKPTTDSKTLSGWFCFLVSGPMALLARATDFRLEFHKRLGIRLVQTSMLVSTNRDGTPSSRCMTLD